MPSGRLCVSSSRRRGRAAVGLSLRTGASPAVGQACGGLSSGTDAGTSWFSVSPRVLGSRRPFRGDGLFLSLHFSTFDLGQKIPPASSHPLWDARTGPRRPGQRCAPQSERGCGQSSSFAKTQFSTLDNEAQSVLQTADWPVRGRAGNAARGPPPLSSSAQLSPCPGPRGLSLASPAMPSLSNASQLLAKASREARGSG